MKTYLHEIIPSNSLAPRGSISDRSKILFNSFFFILFILSFSLLIIFITHRSSFQEKFAWNCVWTPNINYYKQDWLLGDLSRIADDNIKQPY